MRKIVLGIFFSLIAICSFAKDSPLENYKYRHKLYGEVELTTDDGTKKSFNSIEQVFDETDGWTYIEGSGKIHFWLYDSSNMDGDDRLLLYTILPEWVEKMGYVIDYTEMGNIFIYPDERIPSSVKALMRHRGRDTAVALITSDTSYPYGNYGGSSYLVIHGYFGETGDYCALIYPLY